LDIGKIVPVDIHTKVHNSYMDYSMSVIVGRALPDVRDGLKPVHRRILYAMHEAGMTADKPHKKSAVVVGNVLAKYHPHGDASVYDALVRMAQDFSCRYPLVDGHGNFGSVDGDSPAAMRYTEVRMPPIAAVLLSDTVDFVPNYDDSLKEPAVLPSRVPNLLINGSTGIAVGMATNIPPHNISEVIDGVLCLIDNPEATVQELMGHIKGPDFPTAGLILGTEGIRQAYETGRGSIVMQGKATIETTGVRNKILITELPYQVNKAQLVARIAEMIKDKTIEGISDLRDESDRTGMQIAIELRKEADPNVILNCLYKHTSLRETFGFNMLALVKGVPLTLNLKAVLTHYLEYQIDVITRRTQYQLAKAKDRLHIVEGLSIAIQHIDEIVALIKRSATPDEARTGLMREFALSEIQSQAILDMRLQRLTGLERDKIENERRELEAKIAYLEKLLSDQALITGVVRDEILVVKKKFGDARRTRIVSDAPEEFSLRDTIAKESVVITLTHRGYIKRTLDTQYRAQHRGGQGVTGVTIKEADFIEYLFTANTLQNLLFFTNRGRVYKFRVYDLPEAGRQAKGTAIVNLLKLSEDENVTAIIPIGDNEETANLFMATRQGTVKKGSLKDYTTSRKDGIVALTLSEDDELISVKVTSGEDAIILATRNGQATCFDEKKVRVMGRSAAGVRGVRLGIDDYVVGLEVVIEGQELLVVTEYGYGKRTPLEEYRVQGRGNQGVTTAKITQKNGHVVGIKVVEPDDELLLISSDGSIIRINVKEISQQGRSTQGVRLMELDPKDRIIDIAKIHV